MCNTCSKPALKIEAGKYYRRRNGEKVFCLSVAESGPFLGMPDFPLLMQTKSIKAVMYRADGLWVGGDMAHELDITGEWREPRTTEAIAAIYETGGGNLICGIGPQALGHAIGSIKVTITEGKFAS